MTRKPKDAMLNIAVGALTVGVVLLPLVWFPTFWLAALLCCTVCTALWVLGWLVMDTLR